MELYLFLRIDVSEFFCSLCQYQLTRIIVNHLDQAVVVAKHKRLLCDVPLLNVRQWIHHLGIFWGVFFAKSELDWLELGIPVKIRLEVLQQDHFFVDFVRVLKE